MGLISRDGIIPLALTNDIGGPICKTVEDAARVLNIIAGYDPADTVTRRSQGNIPADYLQFLDKNGLKRARIGVFRQLCLPAKADSQVVALFDHAIEELRQAGATIVDRIARSRKILRLYVFHGRISYFRTLNLLSEFSRFHQHNACSTKIRLPATRSGHPVARLAGSPAQTRRECAFCH